MTKLCLHPLFLLGLVIRLALIFTAVPLAEGNWYLPFLDNSISHFSLDPWSTWLASSGTPIAFPYGYTMWFAFLPLALAAKLLNLPFEFAYEFTILAADFALLLALKTLVSGQIRLLLLTYWLSPIVILGSYAIGLNDLVPVLLLTWALYYTRKLKMAVAGAICFAAISAKFSMVLALPFFLIYLFNNRALRRFLPRFLFGFFVSAVFLGLPFLFSRSGLYMVFSNPEMDRVYRIVLDLGGNVSVYVVPLMYLVMLYMTWRVRRLNFELLHATLGMAFLLIVLLTPASPGWFIWSIPLLVWYQAKSGRIAIALTGFFSALYVLSTLLMTPLRLVGYGKLDVMSLLNLSQQHTHHAVSLLHTLMVATGIVLALRIWRETVSRSDFFRLSRKPFVIGIAGDSGAGKDTFSDAIQGLFGQHSVVKLSGDDYHLWDRQKPMWQVMTHLNPRANDLENFSNDLVALADGKSIRSHHYDHQTGKMSQPVNVRSNDFVIASGLHALYLPILRRCYHLSVYLDIDEGLRRHFKIQRDVTERGYSTERVLAAFEKREPDSVRFIRPQQAHADLVFSLQPMHPATLENFDNKHPLRLKLVVRTRDSLNELSLARVLVGVCGLHVDMATNHNISEVVLTVDGDTCAEDIALAARMLCPRILEFLDIEPKWQDGIVGLMQLITLSHINQALIKRFI